MNGALVWEVRIDTVFRRAILAAGLLATSRREAEGWLVPTIGRRRSLGKERDLGPVAFPQFFIAGVERGIHLFGQGDVRRVVGGEIVAEFPYAADQGRMRKAFRRQDCECVEDLLATSRTDSVACDQASSSADYFNIEQMRRD